MRLVLQRVRRAAVAVAGQEVAAIGAGLLVLVGFGREDGPDFVGGPVCAAMLGKVRDLRLFPDAAGRFDASLDETGGGLLLVSQFTLHAVCRKGRRPSFSDAAPPGLAGELFDQLVDRARALLPGRVQSGLFGADMDVSLVNWGPVTILLDSADFRRGRPLDGARHCGQKHKRGQARRHPRHGGVQGRAGGERGDPQGLSDHIPPGGQPSAGQGRGGLSVGVPGGPRCPA